MTFFPTTTLLSKNKFGKAGHYPRAGAFCAKTHGKNNNKSLVDSTAFRGSGVTKEKQVNFDVLIALFLFGL